MKTIKNLVLEIDLEELDIALQDVDRFLTDNFKLLMLSLNDKKIRIGGCFSLPQQQIIGRIVDTEPLLNGDDYGICNIDSAKLEKFRVVGCGYITIYAYIRFDDDCCQNGDLKELLDNEYYLSRPPAFMVWTIANICNLACKHCYYFPADTTQLPYLPLEDCFRIIDEVANANVRCISFSGGEVLLVKHIRQVIAYAKKRKLKVIFNSNLALMDESMADFLKEQSVDLVITSLESPDGAIHDEIRGNNAFEGVVRGIKICVLRGLQVGINMAVTKINCGSLTDIIEFAQSMGVSFVKFEALIPTGRAINNYESLAPTVQEYFKLSKTIDAICDKYYDKIPIIISNVFERMSVGKRNFCCPSGQLFYTITYKGDIAICPSLTSVQTESINLLRDSFKTYLEQISFREQGEYDSKCKECEYFTVCKSGCFSRSYFKNKVVRSCDPMCEFFNDEGLIYCNKNISMNVGA